MLGSLVNSYIALLAVAKLFNNMPINFFLDKCKMPLGLEDFRLDSGALTASSSVNYNHGPERARLNWPSGHSRAGGWVAKVRNSNQWLQVELDRPAKITGVATQGRYDAYQWVTTYTVSYSMDGKTFKLYLEYGRNKVTKKKLLMQENLLWNRVEEKYRKCFELKKWGQEVPHFFLLSSIVQH